jgi:hypothetical protein
MFLTTGTFRNIQEQWLKSMTYENEIDNNPVRLSGIFFMLAGTIAKMGGMYWSLPL